MSKTIMARLYSSNKEIGTMKIRAIPEDCEIDLVDGLDFLEMPAELIRGYCRNGERHFTGEVVGRAIRNRVEPSGRMNIDAILADFRLKTYDPVGLFVGHRGKCVMDKVSIKLESEL